MNLTDTHRDPVQPAQERTLTAALRWTGVVALAVGLFVSPLLFGAVETWAWGLSWCLAALALAAAVLTWVSQRQCETASSALLWVLVVLAALALFQLAPLPSRLVGIAPSGTRSAYTALFGRAPGRFSLVPAATVEAFLKTTLVLMAVFAALVLVKTRALLFTLVGALIGAALVASLVGIIQEKGTSERIYGVRSLSKGAEERSWRSAALDPALSSGVGRIEAVEYDDGTVFFKRTVNVGDVFGPYANSNHFCGLMEIVLPTVFALVLAFLHTRKRGWGEEGGVFGTSEGGLLLFLMFVLAAGVGAAVYSGSAAGMAGLALGLAVVLTVSAAAGRAGKVVLIVAALAAVAAGIVLYMQSGPAMDAVSGKLLQRTAIWKATWSAAKDFPVAGSGLGTFAYVIPHYETTEMKHIFAHNDYLQLALEAGLVFSGVLAVLAGLHAVRLVKGSLKRSTPYCSALSAGALGAAAAMGFHGIFDFNLHIPANAVLFAVLLCLGGVAAGAHLADLETMEFARKKFFVGAGRSMAGAGAVLAAVALAGGLVAVHVFASLARSDARAVLAAADPAATEAPGGLRQATHGVERAARLLPWDAGLKYQAAQLAALGARFAQTDGAAATLRGKALALSVESANLARCYTFYMMTVETMGTGGLERLERWPMSAFGYRKRLAEILFESQRNEDGLREMREAIALEIPDMGFAPERAMETVTELLERFGSYERIAQAAPDSFGGHILFGRGLASAGLGSAAFEQYLMATRTVEEGGRLDGFNERSAMALAERLVSYGELEQAGRFYALVLERNPGWQVMRLSYAGYLARVGEKVRAAEEIHTILSSGAPSWLSAKALALRQGLNKQ